MVFITHKSLKSDIIFDPIFIPCFLGSRFFRVQVFQLPGFSGSKFLRGQVFQGPDFLGFRFLRVQVFLGPGFSGCGSRIRVQVLEKAGFFFWRKYYSEFFTDVFFYLQNFYSYFLAIAMLQWSINSFCNE